MDLKNLKAGQTKTAEVDGVTVTVEKLDGGYGLTVDGETAGLRYDKDAKTWQLVLNQVAYDLDASAKTAVSAALAYWTKLREAEAKITNETADEPTTDATVRERKLAQIVAAIKLAQDERGGQAQSEAALAMVAKLMDKYSITEEEIRRQQAEARGEDAAPEAVETWQYDVNVQGGHAPHRVAAFASVARAMGGGVFFTHHKTKGAGYKADVVTLHVAAQPSVIESLKTFLPLVELQMERLAEEISRKVSHEARLAGGHHSGPGCHARRGFMRGFGAGVAARITANRETMKTEDTGGSTALVLRDRTTAVDEYMAANHPDLKVTKAQKYDGAAWVAGHAAGTAFASPKIASESERQLENA
jgi:hypothetical protein